VDRRINSVQLATPEEQLAHEAMLIVMAKRGRPLWRELETPTAAEPAVAA
jgi:hypothetical protein